MAITNQTDKRLFPRVDYREPLQVLTVLNGIPKGTLSQDISEGGIRFLSNEFLPIGEEVALTVTLKSGKVLDCTGEVVWIRQVPFSDRFEAGCQIKDSLPEYRNGILQLQNSNE